MSELRGVLQLFELHAGYTTGETETETETETEREGGEKLRERERCREGGRETRQVGQLERGWEGEEGGTRGQGMERKRETNEVRRVREIKGGGGERKRETYQHIFNSHITLAIWVYK